MHASATALSNATQPNQSAATATISTHLQNGLYHSIYERKNRSFYNGHVIPSDVHDTVVNIPHWNYGLWQAPEEDEPNSSESTYSGPMREL